MRLLPFFFVFFTIITITQQKNIKKNRSTCGSAHKQCELNETCKWHLSEVHLHCLADGEACVRSQCAAALRRFSRFVSRQLGEAVVFCQCETADKNCNQLQHVMFPKCMYSYGRNTSLETCTKVVHDCKIDSYCNRRLPELKATCSNAEGSICKSTNIDACRKSIMSVRGTNLEMPCHCQSDDKECLALQALMLPNNPCIELAIDDYTNRHPEFFEPKALESDSIQLNAEHSLDSSKYDIASEKNEDVSASALNVPPPLTNKKDKTTKLLYRNKFQKKRPSSLPATEAILPRHPVQNNSGNSLIGNSFIATEIAMSINNWNNVKTDPLALSPNITQPLLSTDGCSTRNIEGNWIVHHKNAIVRQYNDWSGLCSQWCQCLENQTLSCKELPCLPESSCMTSKTTVGFGERLYINRRGACICISGNFICELSDDLPKSLKPGLYITLGYSKNELQMFKENVPKPIIEVSGLVSPSSSVLKDIVSRLQYTMEKKMPKGMLCRIVILNDYAKFQSAMLQVQYYGLDVYTNVTEPKWQIGRMEKVCAPYVRQLEYIFLLEKAERYQLVLSTVKQIKVVDHLDGLPELSKARSSLYIHCVVICVKVFVFFLFFTFDVKS